MIEKLSRIYHGNGLYFEGPNRWRLKYKFAGKEYMMSLGTNLNKVDAQVEACRAKAQIAKGLNPSVMRKAEKAIVMSDSVYTTRSKIAKTYLALFADKREAMEFLDDR